MEDAGQGFLQYCKPDGVWCSLPDKRGQLQCISLGSGEYGVYPRLCKYKCMEKKMLLRSIHNVYKGDEPQGGIKKPMSFYYN